MEPGLDPKRLLDLLRIADMAPTRAAAAQGVSQPAVCTENLIHID